MYSAKMDSTENDLPPSAPFTIGGFPTIKFKKAGSKEFVDYEGDRTLESLISFVEENASTKLEKKVVADDSKPTAQEPVATPVTSERVEAHHHEHDHDEL